jgi:gas vesicle protein
MKKIISSLVIGAAMGIAAGILIAPRSGEKTRKRLAMRSKKLKNQLSGEVSESFAHARNLYTQKLDEIAKSSNDLLTTVKSKMAS